MINRFPNPAPPLMGRLDWEAVQKDRQPIVPIILGTANTYLVVWIDGDQRVCHKEFHQKPMLRILREGWQATFASRPPF